MTLGEKLFKLRKQKGMSQEELAEHLDVSRQAISKWELGESLPDTKNIIQLGKLFEISMDYLLNDDIDSADLDIKSNPISESKETVSQNHKRNLSRPTIIGFILSALGVCGLFIFWILSITNPAEYHGANVYDGLQGFLLVNNAGSLFIFCCCVILVGFGIIVFDRTISQSKRKSMKISKMQLGCVLSFLGTSGLLLFWIFSFTNPVLTYSNNNGLLDFLRYHSDFYWTILFIACICTTIVGIVLITSGIAKKNIPSSKTN